jgi:RNA polymerase sigma-70 factor (sigma-E family)
VQVREVAVDSSTDEDFSQFMQARWPQLVRLGYGLTGDLQTAEDLAQTAFAKAYASWWRVRRADDPDAYVRRIVVNANRNRFRKSRVSELLTDSLPELPAADEVGRRDDRAILIRELMRLSHGQRAAVVLRYWLDLSEAETAAVLGCSVGNVKSQAARGLAKLRTSAALLEGGLR